MPPIGLLLGNVDFSNLFMTLKEGSKAAGPYASLAAAKAAGAVTLNLGVFINTIISFIIIAFAVFLVIKGFNHLKREKEAPAAAPSTKDCPFCFTNIPIQASRCPHCTSQLAAAQRREWSRAGFGSKATLGFFALWGQRMVCGKSMVPIEKNGIICFTRFRFTLKAGSQSSFFNAGCYSYCIISANKVKGGCPWM